MCRFATLLVAQPARQQGAEAAAGHAEQHVVFDTQAAEELEVW